MKTQFTQSTVGENIERINQERGIPLAFTFCPQCGRQMNPATIESDQRIIAHMHETLFALQSLVNSLEAKQKESGLDGFNVIRDFHAARAAIAKATGGEV